MSHDATNWAIKQRNIRPSAKLVLWQLCDRYHPDHGCFPSLETLAHDSDMSRRSVQDQIAYLVKEGLLAVAKRPRKCGKLPRNSYHFPFEACFAEVQQNQEVDLGKSCLGQNLPWANQRGSLGQNLPTNLVRGTSKGVCGAREGERQGDTIPEKAPPAADAPPQEMHPAADAPPQQMHPPAPDPDPDPSATRTPPRSGAEPGVDTPPDPTRPPDGPPPPADPAEAEAARLEAGRKLDSATVERLTHALGFDHHGKVPKGWHTADARMIVSRWRTELGLTPDEIVDVATSNMRAFGEPAERARILTPAMQDYAAVKAQPRLEPKPLGGPAHERQNRPDRTRRNSDSATDALVRRVNAAARIGDAP